MKNPYSLDELEDAYKRLKAHVTFDRSAFGLKRKIAEFETERKEKTAKSRIIALYHDLEKDFDGTISRYAQLSSIDVKPKSLSAQDTSIISNVPNKTSFIERYSYHIAVSVELHIIDIAWIVRNCNELEFGFIKRSYGNRLNIKENNTFIFRRYFPQYKKWRDGALYKAKQLHAKKSIAIISFDIKQFYHSVKTSSKTISNILEKTNGHFYYEVWRQHKEKLDAMDVIVSSDTPLPIGLYSSAIFANIALSAYDVKASKLHENYYARYVDDIIIVTESKQHESKDKYLSNLSSVEYDSELQSYYINSNEQRFHLANEKTQIFYLSSDYPSTPLDEYKQKLEEMSSEWRFVTEVDDSNFDIAQSSTEIDAFGSLGTPKSLEGIGVSKHLLSKRLNNLMYSLSIITSIPNKDAKTLASSLIYSFLGSHAISLYELWERAFTVLYLSNNHDAAITLFQNLVKSIKQLKGNDANQISACKNFLIRHLHMSMIIAVCNCGKKITRAHANIVEGSLVEIGYKKITNQRLPLYLQRSDMHRSYLTSKPFFIEASASNSNKSLHSKYEMYMDLIEREILGSVGFTLDPIMHINELESDIVSGDRDLDTLNDENSINPIIGITNFNHIDGRIESSLKKSLGVDVELYNTFAKLINEAIRGKCSILVFPELSIPLEIFGLLAYMAKKSRMIIIGGLEYLHLKGVIGNFSFALLPFYDGHKNDVRPILRAKSHYAPVEIKTFSEIGAGQFWTSSKNFIVRYKNISFSIFNCYELADIKMREQLKGEIDLLVAIEYNKDVPYYSNIVESTVRDLHCFVAQVNAGEYGDSRLTAPLSSQVMNICRIKGGKNNYLVMKHLDIYSLRKSQINIAQKTLMYNKFEIKSPPPGFTRK